MCRYSPTNPSTGLHPRPSSPQTLAPLFPPNSIKTSYTSTVYPSRHGESLRGLQDRADLFVEAWTSRMESEGEDVRCVVVFGHAASVIALGRAVSLTVFSYTIM
jgi:transcription factor C subunit 7